MKSELSCKNKHLFEYVYILNRNCISKKKTHISLSVFCTSSFQIELQVFAHFFFLEKKNTKAISNHAKYAHIPLFQWINNNNDNLSPILLLIWTNY